MAERWPFHISDTEPGCPCVWCVARRLVAELAAAVPVPGEGNGAEAPYQTRFHPLAIEAFSRVVVRGRDLPPEPEPPPREETWHDRPSLL